MMLVGTTLTLALALGAAPAPADTSAVQRPAYDPAHRAWTDILQRRVRAGFVDYATLKAADLGRLERYLAALGSVAPKAYADWGRSEKIAYWINVYNAFTVKLVLDHYPLKSLRALGATPGAAFHEPVVTLPGMRASPYSLDEVEHEVLRKQLGDPRIHFAIVCASASCPSMRPEAYRGSDLQRQLDDAARQFLRDKTKNRVVGKTLRLSAIFKWFRQDFEKSGGSLEGYVRRYVRLDANRHYEIEYLDYDWSLNGL